MAEAGRLRLRAAPAPRIDPVTLVRIGIIAGVLVFWELIARSGLLYRDVVPSLLAIGGALVKLLSTSDFYWNLGVTASEVGTALLIGGLSGVVVGLLLGGSRLLSKAYEPYLYYLGPTPKIIFFPVMIMWVGVEFLINFGGLGQLINDLAERYDLPGTYAAICFVILVSVCFFVLTEWIERWLRPVD